MKRKSKGLDGHFREDIITWLKLFHNTTRGNVMKQIRDWFSRRCFLVGWNPTPQNYNSGRDHQFCKFWESKNTNQPGGGYGGGPGCLKDVYVALSLKKKKMKHECGTHQTLKKVTVIKYLQGKTKVISHGRRDKVELNVTWTWKTIQRENNNA